MASVSESVDFNVEEAEISGTQPSSSRPRKGRRLRSKVWQDFERIVNDDGSVTAICRYCGKHLVGSSTSGTKHLSNHVLRCSDAQRFKESRDAGLLGNEANNEKTTFMFDDKKSREDFAKMVIVHQYPFAITEHAFFQKNLKNVQPNFTILSRNTIKSDCMKLYAKEKDKLYSSLERLTCRVSLTSDMWTSIGNVGYLCLTCHYIDDDWNLKKKILNFEYVEAPHGHNEIKNVLLDKLLKWNIDKKLFSIVLDNASANNKAVKKFLCDSTFQKSLPLDGIFFHVRCSAHILNLIVQDGLKEIDNIIVRIRDSVKHVKSSQQRKENFMKAVRREKGPHKSLVLDVPTRWNTTYHTLETDVEFEDVFSCLHLYDPTYVYAPSVEDWENIKLILECLSVFCEVTERLSGSKFPTSNLFFGDICIIHISLKEWCCHSKSFVSSMASRMLIKFEKYWSKMNVLLAIVAILDPQIKMYMVRYFFEKIYGGEAEEKIKEVKIGLQKLYDTYVTSVNVRSVSCDISYGSRSANVSCMTTISKRKANISSRSTLASMYIEFDHFLHQSSLVQSEKLDLQTYLEEPPKQENDLDILKWWKINSAKYPSLSMVARDVLAIPMSTVASESTFSIGSRVLNKYRSSLDPMTVQALICTENWLRNDISSIDTSEEDTLSTIFASSKISDENEEQALGFYDIKSLMTSSSSD